jgi:hypothetical protein
VEADSKGYVAVERYREVRTKRKVHYCNSYPPTTVVCGEIWEFSDTVDEKKVTCKKCLQYIKNRGLV